MSRTNSCPLSKLKLSVLCFATRYYDSLWPCEYRGLLSGDVMDMAAADVRDYLGGECARSNMTKDEAAEDDDSRPAATDRVGDETPVQQRHRWPRQFEVAIKSMGVIAFLLSCVALWPAVASASDTKMATRLAKWTSLKDFLEFCESVGSIPSFSLTSQVEPKILTLLPKA